LKGPKSNFTVDSKAADKNKLKYNMVITFADRLC